jgi:hypothetical protein
MTISVTDGSVIQPDSDSSKLSGVEYVRLCDNTIQ